MVMALTFRESHAHYKHRTNESRTGSRLIKKIRLYCSKADLDKDGKIMLSELKDYMYKAVPALTDQRDAATYFQK